jgi:UDP-N-acetylmuramoyl-tripeptide--D-alanyl-D-alanine ligase
MKKLFLALLFKILKSESKHVLEKFQPQIIAITGSIAKSSTKEAVFSVLQKKYGDDVWKSYGNLNTKFGVPLAILGFKRSPRLWEWLYFIIVGFVKSRTISKYPKFLVLEFGADKPGDFEDLLSYIRPNMAIITLIGPAHLEFFNSVENLYKEKVNLIKTLPTNGIAILNQNDERINEMKLVTSAKIVLFDGNGFNIAKNAAEKIGEIFNINNSEIIQILDKIKPLEGRMNLIHGYKNCKIIDDTYNSNPLSVRMALEYLNQISNNQNRKIAILGEMRELGNYTSSGHEEVVNKARKIADVLILVGEYFKPFKGKNIWFETTNETTNSIKEKIKINENDIILIKGSRKMEMEKIVDVLKG